MGGEQLQVAQLLRRSLTTLKDALADALRIACWLRGLQCLPTGWRPLADRAGLCGLHSQVCLQMS